MNTTVIRAVNVHRRRFLLGGAALVLQSCGGGGGENAPAASSMSPASTSSSTQGVAAKPEVSLAAFGGVPGASPATLANAFSSALASLAAAGGGSLLVEPGIYDFGRQADPVHIVAADGLSDVFISAYGAQFIMTTVADVTPALFYFSNPNDVTVAGASFKDLGYNGSVNWHGMYCVKAEASRPSSGIRMIDCQAENVVGLFQLEHSIGRGLLQNANIQGTLKECYYGADLIYPGEGAMVDLICEDVRRGFIAYGAKNANVRIRMQSNLGSIGSNGFIALVCEGEALGDVEDVRIDLRVSGFSSHSGLVHFYHQQAAPQGYMRNIDATVVVDDFSVGSLAANVFVFDHELPDGTILRSTTRGWDRIFLHGSVPASLAGRVITNPSVSTAPGTIFVDPGLSALADNSMLSEHFQFGAA